MLAFQAGDDAAFDRLVLDYQGQVRRVVRRYVLDHERAEDLSQEVFLRVWRARKRYRPTASFRTWLFTIATRLCLNELRSRRRERRVVVPFPAARGSGKSEEEEFLDGVADPGARRAEEKVMEEEMAQAIEEAMADLPPAQRMAIVLLRYGDLSYQEIAEALGVSVMAVKSLINRGREGLRSRLARFLTR